jgi:hypothetical protein
LNTEETDAGRLKEKLSKLSYPRPIVIYGPSRTYRTIYRGEHGEVFYSGIATSDLDVWNTIKELRYRGRLSEMTIHTYYYCNIDEIIYEKEIQ